MNGKLRQAIGAGTVSADPAATTTSSPNVWDPHMGTLKSGKTGKIYQRMSTGDWKIAGPGGRMFPRRSPQAIQLEKEKRALLAPAPHPDDTIDLAESTYTKLNKLFESIMSEGTVTVHSISDFLMMLVKQDLNNKFSTTVEPQLKQACDLAQKQYKQPAEFMKVLNNLGQLVYSIASK